MSTAVVFLNTGKTFVTTWYTGLLFKLSKLELSTSLTKLISSFLSQRKFSVSVEVEMSTPRETQAGVPQGSVLSPTFYNTYINEAPQTAGVYVALFLPTALVCTRQIERRILLSEN
jgi:hypothetical protein